MGRKSDAGERLVTAMACLVHQRGYLAVGVDDVCREAGVKKGSFYHFFASKRDLMLAALERQWEMGAQPLVRAAFSTDQPPLKRIERMLEMVAHHETSNKTRTGQVLGCPFGNLASELAGSETVLMKRAEAALCDFAVPVREALNEAKRLGEVPRRLDVKKAAEAIVAYFEGVLLLARARNDPLLIRRLGPLALQLATAEQQAARPRRRARAVKP